ncbi:DNA repair protein RAD50 isoform X2 [Adelges cooleyi]|nr:DNA repair protein RAD50 isoform X2 [Adelges cooleyi]XP_050431774.1 DNA repair protein RAD50 isoform X2 [Adelges cooleyi]XP_050431775.1 DNA repair protein RAD50 isoform X2 [Adelges cooleyi]
MSTLNKISIQGIRSYHPDERQTIEFQKPLTLILGENGCGKTTIIECLKYATCSDQPKNTKNGGFVWDPKLSDHVTVKGQVKLYFNDTKNSSVVVSKTLESTQKQKVTTKTLDQTISINGKSASHKCADIDEIMCTYLGVSKPILKDVIFCHQEDSNWPLDEDKKLKEKFDSIFDVGKYDKCIDQIRREIKTVHEDQKISKNNIQFKKKIRDEARDKKATLDDRKTKLEIIRNDIAKIEEECIPLDTRIKEISNFESQLSIHQGGLKCFEQQLMYIQEAQIGLKNEIKSEFKGNDQQLEEELSNFDNNLIQKEREKQELENEKQEASYNENNLQVKINKQEIKRGQYLNEEKQHMSNIQNQNQNLTKLAQDLNIDLNDKVSESTQTQVIDKITNSLKNMNNVLESTQNQYRQVEHELQLQIDETRERKAKLEHEIHMKEKQIKETGVDIKNTKEAVEEVKHSANRLGVLKNEMVEIDKKLEELNRSLDVNNIKKCIEEKHNEKTSLEAKQKDIDKEVQTLQLLSIEQAELNTIRSNKSGIENKLQILKNKVNHVLVNLLGFIPKSNLKYEFNSALEKLTSTIKSNRKSITEIQKKLTTLEANHKHKVENIRTKQRMLSDDENAAYEMCQGQDYDTILKEVNEKVEELQDLKGSVSTSGHLFKRYIAKLQAEKPCCPLCHRGFGSVDDVTELINDLNMRVQQIPDELDNTVGQLEIYLEKQSKLQQMMPVCTRISVLKETEIPNLKKELESIEFNLKKCREELTVVSENNVKLETDESNAKVIQSDITLIDNYINETARLEEKEQLLVAKISKSGSSRNLHEALSEQSSIRSTLSAVCKNIENNGSVLVKYNENLHELQQKKNMVTTEELKIKSSVQAEKGLMEKLIDLQSLETTLNVELNEARSALEPIKSNLILYASKLEQTKKKHILQIEQDGKKIKMLEQNFDNIKRLQISIDDYKKNYYSQRIQDINDLMEKLKKEKQDYSNVQLQIQKKIDFIKEFNTNQKMQKFDLENNKKLRNKMKEEIECINEIQNLKTLIGDTDINILLKEKKKVVQKIESLHTQKNVSRGRQLELNTGITKIMNELMNPDYKDAEKNYLHELVHFEVLNKVEKDLEKYWRALDATLQMFHKGRMQSINAIIKELWANIYNGNDIDYIEIKTSDDNVKPIQTETTKRRIHNYRVVQWKNGTELDMRGRCSAGQKVLACLIIRMALAETFSKNCGILALDEPTTNLDEPNITNLADSLSHIVARRSCQRSFQLIIITHDPNFLRKLSASDKVDKFYNVKRSPKGMSIVQEKEIAYLS